MAAQHPAKKQRRRPNFVDAASLALITGVKKRRDVLLDAEAKREDKAAAWQEVTRDVNAVARYHRDTWEVRRKYKDLRVVAKRKALQLRKYGPTEAEGQYSTGKAQQQHQQQAARSRMLFSIDNYG